MKGKREYPKSKITEGACGKERNYKGRGFSMDRERKLVGAMDIKRDCRSVGENNELNRSHF